MVLLLLSSHYHIQIYNRSNADLTSSAATTLNASKQESKEIRRETFTFINGIIMHSNAYVIFRLHFQNTRSTSIQQTNSIKLFQTSSKFDDGSDLWIHFNCQNYNLCLPAIPVYWTLLILPYSWLKSLCSHSFQHVFYHMQLRSPWQLF